MTDQIKYIDCPECRGIGNGIELQQTPWGYNEITIDCDFCEGTGCFEESDYLVMKLEGIV